jgi:peptide/nickel transport system permease protein
MKFLWTDICFLSIIVLGIIAVALSFRHPPIRRAYQRLFYRPMAMSAGIVIVIFLTIGILDSIQLPGYHHQYTLLDEILSPLGQTFEKSYSAPLALDLYTSETKLVNGQMEQIYPRLHHIAPYIQTHSEKNTFVMSVLVQSLIVASGLLLIVWGIYFFLSDFGKAKCWRFRRTVRMMFFTTYVLIFLCISLYSLSRGLHVLGTGKIGQDILYYAIKSIRTGLVIGILTTLFMLPLALLGGIAAGYFGGWVDDAIQYTYTTLSSIPGVLLITASVLSIQTYIANHPDMFPTLGQRADARLLALCFILGVTSWTSLCRLLRAEVLKLREIDFVQAAHALGSSAWTVIVRHLLPNVMHIVVITLALDFSFLVLAEAVLSYVGVGVSPLTISWGNMINGARLELAREPIVWWPMLAAFVFMFMLVLAGNIFADAIRDAFDPHHA